MPIPPCRRDLPRSKRSRIGRLAVVGAIVMAPLLAGFGIGAARAQDHTLAISTTQKARILAEGGAGWCRERLLLRMMLQPDSPASSSRSDLVALMNRLRTPITTDCKAATGADLTVVIGGEVAGTYRADSEGGWMFTAVPAAVPPANLDDAANLDGAALTPSPAAPGGDDAVDPFQNPAFLAMTRDMQEKVLSEGDAFQQNCRSKTIYAAKHDCACLSRRYMDYRLKHGHSKSDTQVAEELKDECIDAAATTKYAYNKCMDVYVGLYKVPLDKLCECYSIRFTQAYIKEPIDLTRREIHMGSLAVESCRKELSSRK